MTIGPLEIMMILLIALVVVGPSRLPEVARSIGRGLREFRKVQDEVRDSINFNLDEPFRPEPTPTPNRTHTPARPTPVDDEPDPAPAPAAAEPPVPPAATSREDASPAIEPAAGDHDTPTPGSPTPQE